MRSICRTSVLFGRLAYWVGVGSCFAAVVLPPLVSVAAARHALPLATPAPATMKWHLATDFRVGASRANPNPDRYGHRDVWYFLEALVEQGRNPRGYKLLLRPIMITACPGAESWTSLTATPNSTPAVFKNSGGAVCYGVPVGAVSLSPAPDRYAIVAWRSPVTGTVRAQGSFADSDGSCGDGVNWYVDKADADLKVGALSNGGRPQRFDITARVIRGDFLYFAVGPKGSESCDGTPLDLMITITATGPSDLCPKIPAGAYDFNRNGCPGPFKLIKADLPFPASTSEGFTTFDSFVVRNIPARSLLTIISRLGREQVRAGANGRAASKKLPRKPLPGGSVITVTVTKPGWIGYFARLKVLTVSPGRRIIEVRCIPAVGPKTPKPCAAVNRGK